MNHITQLDIYKANYPIIGQMNCDGLVFTPSRNVPYYQTMVVKFKPSERLSVDFIVQLTNDLHRSDVAQLKLGDNIAAGELKLDKATKQVLGIGGQQQHGHNNRRFMSGSGGIKKIVECEFDRASGLWRLVQVRHDKIKSNSPSTAWSVLESIAEHVQLNELVEVLSKVSLLENMVVGESSQNANARDHYDARQKHRDENGDLDSRIRVLNLNNFVKGSLIGTGGALDLQKLPEHVDQIPKLLLNAPSKPGGKHFRNKQQNKSQSVRVLDLACGRGGDLGKWFKSHSIELYVGLDISPASLAEAERRAKDMMANATETCLFLESDASKDDFCEMIMEKLKTARGSSSSSTTTTTFDFVSIQFALHYFCQSPETFEVFLNRVKPLCTPRTKILVTMLDEAVVTRKLGDKSSWQNDVCKIEALEKDEFRTIINFSLGDAVVELPEPLVSYQAMEQVLNKAGFKITGKANTSSFLAAVTLNEFGRALTDDILIAFGKNHNDRAISASEWEALQLYCLMTIELL